MKRPPRPCPRCGRLHSEKQCPYCPPPKAWQKNNEPTRMRGRKLQRERERLFRDNPLCVECEKRGIIRVATQRDHIVPLAEGGLDVPSNTQGLCDECHKAKVAEESRRGKARARTENE